MVLAFDVIRKRNVTNPSIGFLPVKLDIPGNPPRPAPVPPAQRTCKGYSLSVNPVSPATLAFPEIHSVRTETAFHLHIGAAPATHQRAGFTPSTTLAPTCVTR